VPLSNTQHPCGFVDPFSKLHQSAGSCYCLRVDDVFGDSQGTFRQWPNATLPGDPPPGVVTATLWRPRIESAALERWCGRGTVQANGSRHSGPSQTRPGPRVPALVFTPPARRCTICELSSKAKTNWKHA